jgi:carbamate kinase
MQKKNSLDESATKTKQVKIFFAYETFKSFFSNKDIQTSDESKNAERYILETGIFFFEISSSTSSKFVCVCGGGGGGPVLKDVFGVSPSNDVSLSLWT